MVPCAPISLKSYVDQCNRGNRLPDALPWDLKFLVFVRLESDFFNRLMFCESGFFKRQFSIFSLIDRRGIVALSIDENQTSVPTSGFVHPPPESGNYENHAGLLYPIENQTFDNSKVSRSRY